MSHVEYTQGYPRKTHSGAEKSKLIKFAKSSFESFKKGIDKKILKHLDKKEADLKQKYDESYNTVENIAKAIFSKKEESRIPLEVAVNDLSKIAVKLVDIELKRRLRVEKKSKIFKLNLSTLNRVTNFFKNTVKKIEVKKSYQQANENLYSAARNKKSTFVSELERLRDYNNYSNVFMPASINEKENLTTNEIKLESIVSEENEDLTNKANEVSEIKKSIFTGKAGIMQNAEVKPKLVAEQPIGSELVQSLQKELAGLQTSRKNIEEQQAKINFEYEELRKKLKQKENNLEKEKASNLSSEKAIQERLNVAQMVSEGFGLEEILEQVPNDQRLKYARMVEEVEMQMRHYASAEQNTNAQKKA